MTLNELGMVIGLAVFLIGPVLFCIGLIRAALSPRRRK